MTVLHLGVVDIKYQNKSTEPKKVAKPQRGKRNRPVKAPDAPSVPNETTGDVAEILEKQYHIMENFAHRYGDVIASSLANSVAGALTNLMAGAPPTNNPFGSAEMVIEDSFKAFLDNGEMDGMPGVPTMAAQKGVNHRLKHPYAKSNPPRESFIDTGLFQQSFKAWVE